MTVEVTPLDVACNLSCTYCYQNPIRDAGNTGGKAYDMELMKAELRRVGQHFTIFGGEPLLVPIEDLEELWRFGLETHHERVAQGSESHGSANGIQTNGALITEAHLDLFQKYNVHVGFSMDGPDELNDARWSGTLDKTREATRRSQWAIEECLKRGIAASLILTLHRGNVGTPDRFARVKEWLRGLESLGMLHARLHNLEIEYPEIKSQLELTDDENIVIFAEFARFEAALAGEKPEGVPSLRFDIYHDIEQALGGSENVTCTWSPCDPYTTAAVHGIDGQGRLSNCQRANKDGVNWVKADTVGKERQFALYNTPQEHGGCQGCRFFLMCKGQCPGTAIDGDWRNRSKDCRLWYTMFEIKEREMLDRGEIPKSVGPDRKQREQAYLEKLWKSTGIPYRMYGHGDHYDGGERPHGDEHGDHYDDARVRQLEEQGIPHGNQHGDHTDNNPEYVRQREQDMRRNMGQVPTERPHGDAPHGDHTDTSPEFGRQPEAQRQTPSEKPHGDAPHGDRPHGDHTDATRLQVQRLK